MDHFELVSEYKPTGDQPEAIKELVEGFKEGNQCQTLLGVTGSGKTFTMANVIQQLNKPTLIIAHNKTLAAQLYGEFKEFFPNNAVEYFVSYYDYYQPEAYVPSTDRHIRFICRNNLHYIPSHPEGSTVKIHIVSVILHINQTPQHLIPILLHPRSQ